MGSVTNLGRADAMESPSVLRAVPREAARADVEAEEAILSAILLDEWGDQRAFERVTAIVGPDDFYDPRARTVFEAIVRIRARGDALGVTTLRAELDAVDRLNTVGGVQYLGHLIEAVPTTVHCDTHARLVLDHAAARKIAESARRLATTVLRRGADLSQALAEHAETLRAVRLPGAGVGRLADDLAGLWEETEARAADSRGGRLSTGVVAFDDALGGGYLPGYHLIGARPSLGKTALAAQFCRFQVTRPTPRPVAFFQLEMDRRSMLRTQIAAVARVPYDRVQNPRTFSQDDMTACVRASQSISRWPWFLVARDAPRVPRTVAAIRSAVLGMPDKPAAVVIDHVKKLQPRGRYAIARDAVKEITDDLVGLARELGVPLIVLAHIGRSIAKGGTLCRRPMMEDLSESGSLEEDADSVTLLHSEAVYPTRKYAQGEEPDPTLIDGGLPKVRGAKRGVRFKLRFRGEFQSFESVDGSDRFLWAEGPLDASPTPAADTYQGENIVPNDAPEFDFGGDHG